MDDGLKLTLIIIGCIAIVVAIRLIAKTNTLIGKIFKWWWNIGFVIWSHIPFFGWMSIFMIADTPEDEALKELTMQIGANADKIATDWADSVAEKERRRADIQEKLCAKYGRSDIIVNDDLESAYLTDENNRTIPIYYE